MKLLRCLYRECVPQDTEIHLLKLVSTVAVYSLFLALVIGRALNEMAIIKH